MSFKEWLCALFCIDTAPVPLEQHPLATTSKSDDHLAAHVLDSIAREYSKGKWKIDLTDNNTVLLRDNATEVVSDEGILLFNKGRTFSRWEPLTGHISTLERDGLVIKRAQYYRFDDNRDRVYAHNRVMSGTRPGTTVSPRFYTTINDLPMDEKVADDLFNKVKHFLRTYEATQAAAKLAAERMAIDNAKWNLVEEKLGMVRDENGALKPKPVPEVKTTLKRPKVKKEIMK